MATQHPVWAAWIPHCVRHPPGQAYVLLQSLGRTAGRLSVSAQAEGRGERGVNRHRFGPCFLRSRDNVFP